MGEHAIPRSHDRPGLKGPGGSVDLTAYDSERMPQRQKLRLRVVDPTSDVLDIEQHAQARVEEPEDHRGRIDPT